MKLWSTPLNRTKLGTATKLLTCMLFCLVGMAAIADINFVVSNKTLQAQMQSAYKLLHRSPEESLILAKQIAKQALEQGDDESRMYAEVLVGKSYKKQGLKDEAAKHYLKASSIEQQLQASERDPSIAFFLADGLRHARQHETAVDYIQSGIAIQSIFGDEDYLMKAYDLKSSLHYLMRQYSEAEQNSRLSLSIAERIQAKKFVLRSNRKIAKASKKQGNTKKSLEYNLNALRVAESIGDEAIIATHKEYVSTDQRVLGMYSAALNNAKQALDTQREIGNKYRISNLLLNISIIYMKLSSHDQSLEYAFELLSLHEHGDNQNRIASAYNQIGLVFSRLKRFDDASEYHKRVLSLDDIKHNYRASALRSLANIKLKMNDYKAALDYADKAEEVYTNLSDKSGLATVFFTIAEIYDSTENTTEALYYHDKVIDLAEELGDQWTQARSHIYKGKLLSRKRDGQAKLALEKGIDIAERIGAKTLMLEGYLGLTQEERLLKNNKQALIYFDTAFELIRDIDNNEVDQRIAELKIVHDIKNREQEIESLRRSMRINELELEQQSAELENLNNQNIIASLQLKEQRSKFIYLAGVAIIFGLVLSFLLMRYRYLSISQKILAERNREIELKNTHLAELNHTKDRFFSILSHDLRGPIAKIVARSDMMHEFEDELDKEKTSTYLNEIFTASNQAHSLLENLLSWASVQLKNANPLCETHQAYEICESVLHELKPTAKEKGITLTNDVPISAQVYADKNMIRTAIRNLVANAIKFTPHKGWIKIYSEDSAGKTVIHVRDSGVGIKTEDQEKLFTINNVPTKQGTDGEKGTGLGLTLCKILIEKNYGTLNLYSKLGSGSNFYFTLPSCEPNSSGRSNL